MLINILIGLAILHVVGFAAWFAVEFTTWLSTPPAPKQQPKVKRRTHADDDWLDELR